MRYWEDFVIGQSVRLGAYHVSQAEIREFGREFHPLPSRGGASTTDANTSYVLTAPNVLTCCIFMRLLVDNLLCNAASLGSPGLDSVRWLAPVRAGDTLSAIHRVLDSRRLESRPGVGLVKSESTLFNQDDIKVLHMVTNAMFSVQGAGGDES